MESGPPVSNSVPEEHRGKSKSPQVEDAPQVVLILVGLVGSGKSTFAETLQRFRPDFLRCNQDELGNRQRVEAAARNQLRQGRSVCIDRTNIDARQRAVWIGIAREFPRTVTWVLHFDTPMRICEDRLRSRVGHPTITSPEHGITILRRFSSEYQPPAAYEGFDKLLRLDASGQRLEYSQDDIADILDRLSRSSPPVAEGGWRNQGYQSRGYGARGRGPSYGFRGRYPTSGGSYNYRGRGASGGSRGGRGWGQRGSSHPYPSQATEEQPYGGWRG